MSCFSWCLDGGICICPWLWQHLRHALNDYSKAFDHFPGLFSLGPSATHNWFSTIHLWRYLNKTNSISNINNIFRVPEVGYDTERSELWRQHLRHALISSLYRHHADGRIYKRFNSNTFPEIGRIFCLSAYWKFLLCMAVVKKMEKKKT